MSRVLPILFNTDMVRAILDGRKTVTRRVVKPQPQGYFEVNEEPLYIYDADFPQGRIMPPYQPGDILYVRETWNKCGDGYRYKADWEKDDIADITKWRPSIHMSKEAARIWLKVTDIRAERLQDIDGKGILAEGVDNGKSNLVQGKRWESMQKMTFETLWNSTIKKSDIVRYGWDANPWVWVIEFERCEKPEGK